MKVTIILSVFVVVLGVCLAAPLDDSKTAQILRYESDNNGLDGYKFDFATSDGTSRQEQAELKNAGTDQASLSVRGTVKWFSPDGEEYVLNYIADENGFQPEGSHLPKTA